MLRVEPRNGCSAFQIVQPGPVEVGEVANCDSIDEIVVVSVVRLRVSNVNIKDVLKADSVIDFGLTTGE